LGSDLLPYEVAFMSTPSAPRPTPPVSSGRSKHAFVVWATVLGLCLAALAGTYLLFVEAPPPSKIVIAAGGKSGAYYRFGLKYAEELKKEGLTVEVRETAGSVENLQLLQADGSGVALAIVQSGVAEPEDRDRLQALGSVYREPLWVFYRGAEPLDRLSQLADKRIGVGPSGSGTYAVARQLLAANGLVEPSGSEDGARAVLVKENVADAARALQKGELDAAFFVAALEADYIRELLNDDRVRLLSFSQHEAYQRQFRFLSPVTLPAGLINLGQNLPPRDVSLVAPTAMLVARKDLHPALVPLLLNAATRIHGKGDELSNPGEFPSPSYTDIPVSEEAEHYYKSGPPMLQRMLPFWLASLVDRLKVMLIPLIMLLLPLIRAAPPLVRWRTRRKIFIWYSALREIDQRRAAGLSGPEIDPLLARLRDIEQQVTFVEVPLSYMGEVYHLRLHLTMLRETLQKMQARDGAEEVREQNYEVPP
jgi:TRAP transporter TAXI family solute receptor